MSTRGYDARQVMLMRRRFLATTTVCLLAVMAGCSANSGYKPGELGNGGFYFSCDNAVSCNRYSNDASKFPEAVSLGSTFQVRFEPKKDAPVTFIAAFVGYHLRPEKFLRSGAF